MTDKSDKPIFFHFVNCRGIYNNPGDCPVCDRVNEITNRGNKKIIEEIRQIFKDMGVLDNLK